MASRKEEKERLRQQRLEAEQREQAQQKRRLMFGYVAAGILVALIVAGIIVAVANSGGGGSSSSSASAAQVKKQKTNPGSVPASAEGTVTSPPPWAPDYNGLSDRLSAMGLPGLSDTIFHIHAWLHVYVNGKKVAVPADIGLDNATQTFSPLHTHDTTGVIHMEATKPFPFTLGQFFSVWGVRFTDSQLGPYKSGNGNVLQVYFDGKPVKDPVNAVMHEHTDVSVGYGKPGSFPKKPPAPFPPGE